MADIKDFIDQKLIDSLVKINEQLVIAGTNIDNLIPSIKRIENAQKGASKNTKSNVDERKKLTAAEKEAAKVDKQLEVTKTKINSLRKESTKLLIGKKLELQKTTKATKDLQRAQAAQKGSTEQLLAVNVILEKRLKNVNQTTDKGKKSADLYRSAIDKNNIKIKEQSSALTQQKIDIGGYSDGIKEAFGELGIFGTALSKASSFQEKFNKLITGSGKSFKAAAQGTKGASKALRIFKVALISTGIGLIVVAIGAFVALLSKTQKFTDALNIALSAVGAVMDVLVGTVSRLAGVFSKLFKQPLSETFKQAGEAVDGLSDSIVEAAKKGAELERLRQSVRRLGFEFDVSNAKAIQQIELLKAIADDATKSFAERKKANQDAIIAQGKAAAAEFELFSTRKKLADAEFERLKATGNLNDDAREAHAIATKDFIDAETQRLLITRDLEKQRTELKQDELEKNLDIQIDGFDNQKTINERLIADDTLTLRKREAILNETRALFEITFAKQIETIEQFTNASVNANDLIATSDAVVLNEKIRSLGLSEIIEGRLLEIIRERRTAIQDLNEAEQDLANKKLQASQMEASITADLFTANQEEADAEVELEVDKLNKIVEANIKKTDALISEEQRLNDAKKQIAMEGIEIAAIVFNAIQNIAQEDSRLKKAAMTAAAVADKAQAVFRIKIATNIAATQALALPLPPPFPQILAGIYKALGFAQAAEVISRPIPQFAKGVTNFGGGVAELAEQGTEMVKERSGKVWLAENRGLYNLQQGSTVLTAPQTQKELNDKRIVDELKLTRKAIQRQPRQQSESQFDKRQRGMKDGYHMMKNRLN